MWKPTQEQRFLIRQFSTRLKAGNAAIFVGAGLSVPSGLVAWQELLREPAETLGLDVDREVYDLPLLAQYFVNRRHGNDALLIDYIKQRLIKPSKLTLSHEILTSLPVRSFWTTNYDCLIEDALECQGRSYQVRVCDDSFAHPIDADVIVNKLHGTIDRGGHRNLIITRQDYEEYAARYPRMWHEFRNNIVSKSFLFVGFGFSDPNVRFAFSQTRSSGTGETSSHLNITKTPIELPAYEQQKFSLWREELSRIGVESILVTDYSEVPQVLHALELCVSRSRVFVAGSHKDDTLSDFLEPLGAELLAAGFCIVSGAGTNGGEIIIRGAIKGVANCPIPGETPIEMYPFWSRTETGATVELLDERKTTIRKRIIRTCSLCIFISGRDGTYEEYSIARAFRRLVVPIGFTGGTARRIANELLKDEASLRDDIIRIIKDYLDAPPDLSQAAKDIALRLKEVAGRL